MDADNRNELQIHVEGQRIIAYLINDVSKQLISPDLATTTQECLTLALGRILQFYRRCFGKQSHHLMSDLFNIEVGEICNGKTCLIPLSETKKKAQWRCENGKIHETKCPLNWVFEKNKKHCDSNCKGPETETLDLKPDNHHFVQLARTIGIADFYNFFIKLGMEKTDLDNLNFRYFSNPMDFMLMGLFEWRDKTESDQMTATFRKLQTALKAIERQHYLCQVHREDQTLAKIANISLQDVPSDDVISSLTEKKLIGDCIVHLGVELGLGINSIKETIVNNPRNLYGQIHNLLIKWKSGKVKSTIYRLMIALKNVKASEGLAFVMKTYGVKPNYEENLSSENVPRSIPHPESCCPFQPTGTSTKVCVRIRVGKKVFIHEEESGTDSSSWFTMEQINFTKMGIIVLNILTDASYDLLKQDIPNLRPRSECDISYLYQEHFKLNKHAPSNGWGGKWQKIQVTNIAIGDDIERIRLTRNELQHSTEAELGDTRFNELCNILSDLLKRLDQLNKPARLYIDRLNATLAKTVSAQEVQSIGNEMLGMDIEVEITPTQ